MKSLINGDSVIESTSIANPDCLSEYEIVGKKLRNRADSEAH